MKTFNLVSTQSSPEVTKESAREITQERVDALIKIICQKNREVTEDVIGTMFEDIIACQANPVAA